MGVFLAVNATPQSNYNQQEVSIDSTGAGIPELATLNGTVTELGRVCHDINIETGGSPKEKDIGEYLLQLYSRTDNNLVKKHIF